MINRRNHWRNESCPTCSFTEEDTKQHSDLPVTQFFSLPAPFSFLTSFRSLIKSHLPRKSVLVILWKTPHLYQPTCHMSFTGSILHSAQPVSTYQDSVFSLVHCLSLPVEYRLYEDKHFFSVPSTEHNNQHIVDSKYLLLKNEWAAIRDSFQRMDAT